MKKKLCKCTSYSKDDMMLWSTAGIYTSVSAAVICLDVANDQHTSVNIQATFEVIVDQVASGDDLIS